MKRLLFVIVACVLAVNAYSQEHLVFNGATFGLPLKKFVKALPKHSSLKKGYYGDIYLDDLYKIHRCTTMMNQNEWTCFIYSSVIDKTVMKTISVCYFSSLKVHTTNIVRTLENKYGAGVVEEKKSLGKICNPNVTSLDLNYYHNEMMAIDYYVKNSTGKTIGEIRISVAPTRNDNGYIELTYTDYKSGENATNNYNKAIYNAL